MITATTNCYLSFPFRMDVAGAAPALSGRAQHVREVIELVLFTAPQERVFRPEFGTGALHLIFEPNDATLAELTRGRLSSALKDALKGEVDPSTLDVNAQADEEKLLITVSYVLAAEGRRDNQSFEWSRN